MNRRKKFLIGVLSALFLTAAATIKAEDADKLKALADPYANDLGPDTLEGFPWIAVKDYPKEAMEGYAALRDKCAKCHSAARPLNSQFIEPDGPKEGKAAKVKALLAEPGVAQEPTVWMVEEGIWQRYVKRMMAKPGCGINSDEGKKIWAFLCYDSMRRKTGKAAASWKAHRTKLLKEFEAAHPDRHKALYKPAP